MGHLVGAIHSLNLLDSWITPQQQFSLDMRKPVLRCLHNHAIVHSKPQPRIGASWEELPSKKGISTCHRASYPIYNKIHRQNKAHKFSSHHFKGPNRRFSNYYHNYFPFDYYRRKRSRDTKIWMIFRNEHYTSATQVNSESFAKSKLSSQTQRINETKRTGMKSRFRKKWQLGWSCENVLIVQTKHPSSVPCAAETHMNTIGITNDYMEPTVF